ncbi:MAG: BREX-1 system phosphatase PglZ type A, partial [Candidatus Riflebacteria bacterium]|nr:BREX-1 system phosphatase PglZ type A [Candidatus Riflebacteria bacterium]
MDIDKTVNEINKRFSKPLSEFYKRRIIFWYDEEKEFAESLSDIALDNAKLIELTGSNYFTVKNLLLREDTNSNYLVYCPFTYFSIENNPLLDIVLYSEEFRSDLISIWCEEMHIENNIDMRESVKNYRKFFNSKERRAKVAALFSKKNERVNTPSKLHLAVMSVICGLTEPNINNIIRKVLSDGIDDNNQLYKTLTNFNVINVFLKMLSQGMGYESENPNLKDIVAHILVTALSRTLSWDCLPKLDSLSPRERDGLKIEKLTESQKARCFDFISEWIYLNEQEREILYRICLEIEFKYSLPKRLINYELNDLTETQCFPCVNECILIKLMTEITNGIVDSE